jgi:hypothetical protein
MKTCSTCGVEKELKLFEGKSNVYINCFDCRSIIAKRCFASRQKKLGKSRFTETTDMMIVIMLSEKYSNKRIADMLSKKEIDIKDRVKKLKECGFIEREHERLMDYGGVYARKYLRRCRV